MIHQHYYNFDCRGWLNLDVRTGSDLVFNPDADPTFGENWIWIRNPRGQHCRSTHVATNSFSPDPDSHHHRQNQDPYKIIFIANF